MSKLGNFWKTMFAGGAGVAALAALNVAIQRNASEPDESALGGEANFFRWKHGRVFYKTSGRDNFGPPLVFIHGVGAGDRKSTRLNSSHVKISYAVFCLKKKKKKNIGTFIS